MLPKLLEEVEGVCSRLRLQNDPQDITELTNKRNEDLCSC